MTNQERIQSHNEQLAEIKEIAAGLPDAGSSGSDGGAVETCTVTISFVGMLAGYGEAGLASIDYSNIVSGALEHKRIVINQDITTITNVPINAIVIFDMSDDPGLFGGVSNQNCEINKLVADSVRGLFSLVPTASEATLVIGN